MCFAYEPERVGVLPPECREDDFHQSRPSRFTTSAMLLEVVHRDNADTDELLARNALQSRRDGSTGGLWVLLGEGASADPGWAEAGAGARRASSREHRERKARADR